jgi:hypothetical protein
VSRGVSDEPDQQHAGDGGNDGDEQQRPDLMTQQLVGSQADQRPDDCSHGVGEAVEAKYPASVLGRHVNHQKGVARSAAHSLAEPVDHPPAEHHRPHRRHGDE